jgi:pantoate--beta-alanine ligase
VDILFMPTIEMMYEPDELKIMAPAVRGFILEGSSRPGHFDGMLQVVMKLLNLMNHHHPSTLRAYFGKKDAQQIVLIEQMVRNYFLRVEIVPCEIVRDADGLALSSRNVYLSRSERQEALLLSRSLKRASELIMQQQFESAVISQAMLDLLSPIEVEYVAIVNRQFQSLSTVMLGNTIILVAAKVGNTRLIDNLWI